MELGGEQPRDTKKTWAAKINRAEKVKNLFNSIQGYDEICG